MVERADSRLDQRNILKDIVLGIASADLVVADLTSLNPNVFYELGLAHALGIPTVLVTQNLDEIPFDLRAYRANEYSTHFTEAPRLQQLLRELGLAHSEGSISFGSPVTDHLPDTRVPSPVSPGIDRRLPESGEEGGEAGVS